MRCWRSTATMTWPWCPFMMKGVELVGMPDTPSCYPPMLKPATLAVDDLQNSAVWRRKALLGKIHQADPSHIEHLESHSPGRARAGVCGRTIQQWAGSFEPPGPWGLVCGPPLRPGTGRRDETAPNRRLPGGSIEPGLHGDILLEAAGRRLYNWIDPVHCREARRCFGWTRHRSLAWEVLGPQQSLQANGHPPCEQTPGCDILPWCQWCSEVLRGKCPNVWVDGCSLQLQQSVEEPMVLV